MTMMHGPAVSPQYDTGVCLGDNTKPSLYQAIKKHVQSLCKDHMKANSGLNGKWKILEVKVELEVFNNAQSDSDPTYTVVFESRTNLIHKQIKQATFSSSDSDSVEVSEGGDLSVAQQHAPTPGMHPSGTYSSDARIIRAQQGGDISAAQQYDPANSLHTSVQHNRDADKTQAQHVVDIRVVSADDFVKPSITGCVSLDDDKLVVVDNENGKVKRVDLSHNKVISQLELQGGLFDITMVSGLLVAVTAPDRQIIYTVNVSDTLTLDSEIKVKGQCKGIASIDGKLVVSYVKPVKVEIISLTGQVLQTVVTKVKRKNIFIRALYVAVSRDQQTIYISDFGRHTITSVDLAGQVQATYKSEHLRRPYGLTVDRTGAVYVCSWRPDNIMQLTADLTEIKELLKDSDGVEYPDSVCFCETTDRLFIGMFCSDVMKVYQLKQQSSCLLM